MTVRFETARFHRDFDPAALFERVQFKQARARTLRLHADHFGDRVERRQIPPNVVEHIRSFKSSDWHLVTTEVRCDTGKFVN